MPCPNPPHDPLLADVADMGARVAAEEMKAGILPLDRLAHIFRAAIETYLIFTSRSGSPTLSTRLGGQAGPN